MNYLIKKYKGVYRLRAPIDQRKNDFPREIDNKYAENDCYIDCLHGNKITYYGKSILQAYIPSLIRGHNILKAINEINSSIIFDIEETDEEVLFKFKYVDSDKIIPLLKPRTLGANISPFSTRNLPKNKDYKIPDEDLNLYKEIVAKIPPERILVLTHITNSYIKTLVNRRNTMDKIRADMKLKGLSGKNYIHSIGKWKDYIKYMEKNLNEFS
ncbi:hypothetical protein MT487_01880 [Lachnospiraceae bacterium NSJ-171]|nr:hypothetical protein [Lachnospiraceae bacterium NSJ-171]